VIRPSSLSCLHAQNTRDEGGHMTSSSPAREERENIYISFFFFLFSFFWLKFFRQWVYGGANWFHFLLNNCCWKLLFRHRHRHRHRMLILLWNKDEGRHEEVEEEKAVPKQGKKKLRKEKEIVKFRKVTLWVCSSKMLPRKSGARRQGGSVREGSPFEKKKYFF